MKRYEKVNIEAIKVYAGNAKIHPQRQIDQIYGEIFGWASKHKIPLERIETFSEKRFKKKED